MKSAIYFVAYILVGILPHSGQAAELVFRVHSAGGDELYLCDSGIRHLEPNGFVRPQNEFDMMEANYRKWIGTHPSPWSPPTETGRVMAWNGGAQFDASGERIPRTLAATRAEDRIPHIEAKLQTKIDSLKFNFLSPFYGNEYFVDICYRGKALLWPPPGLDTPVNYQIKSWVTATSIVPPSANENRSYLALGRPTLTASLVCDYQNSGPAQGAPQLPNFFESDLAEIPVERESPLGEHLFSHEIYNVTEPAVINPATFERFSFSPVSFDVPLRLIWGNRNGMSGNGANFTAELLYNEAKPNKFIRYCVARYRFAERPSNGETVEGIVRSRSSQAGDAQFDIYLDLEKSGG